MPTSALLLLCIAGAASAATPMTRTWDTVKDVMGMHGKFDSKATPAELEKGLEFAADNYAVITTGTGCSAEVNLKVTIEDTVRAAAKVIKARNPAVRVGMYWRTDMALEVRTCSDFSAEWNANQKAWSVLDDSGKPVMKGSSPYIDYSVPAASAFFGKLILATLKSGDLDYIYFDGIGDESKPQFAGVGYNRSVAIIKAKMNMVRDVQAQLDGIGKGQNIVLNGLDDVEGAVEHTATGAAGSMFDHWSILQFLERTAGQDGSFNTTLMNEAFEMVALPMLKNQTVQIKGWPGPIVKQRDMYPADMVQPNTTALKQKIGAERFNSELALFLLVAGDLDFWIYSWFWGIWDYVPGNAESSVGPAFYPQAKCKLGAPVGPAVRKAGTWTYDRKFAHATVHVDLTDRMASKVEFDEAC